MLNLFTLFISLLSSVYNLICFVRLERMVSVMRHRVLEGAWSVWRAVTDSKIALEASRSFLKSLGESYTNPI